MSEKAVAPFKKMGLAIYINYPDFTELAPHLSEQGKKIFFDGLEATIKYALLPEPHFIEVQKDYSVLVAVGDSKTSQHQKLMTFAETLHKDVRVWTGTFGRIGIPPMTFEMGIAFGEYQISPTAPKISGHAFQVAMSLAKEVCALFNVQVALEIDLARFASDAKEWIDLDDFEVSTTEQGPKTVKRIFTKLLDREEPEFLQMIKDARRAYGQKDFVNAKALFDRLARVRPFKQISEIYLKRIESKS